MSQVLAMTDALKLELPRMLEEHKQIRAVVDAYQGVANELIERGGVEPRASRIRRRQRLGALLNYYCRAA